MFAYFLHLFCEKAKRCLLKLRNPNHQLQPNRRRNRELEPQCERNDQRAVADDDEESRAVIGIEAAEIQPAHRAAIRDLQQPVVQPATAAARAGATNAGRETRLRRVVVVQPPPQT